MQQTQPVRTRKDAQRNRRRVLDAAAALFAERGLDTSIAVIAGRAGVGVGTVYRSFGSKEGLVWELYADQVDATADVIRAASQSPSGEQALLNVVHAVVELTLHNRGLHEIMLGSDRRAGELLRERIAPLLRAVIARAQDEGAVRADFSATDVPLIAHLAGTIVQADSPGAERAAWRMVELVLKGAGSTTPDRAEIPPALTDDEVVEWMGLSFGGRGVPR